jgi:hypothetical protein
MRLSSISALRSNASSILRFDFILVAAHAFLLLGLLVRLLLVARSSGPATLMPRALTVAGTS